MLTSEQYTESKLAAKPDDGGLGRDAFLTLFTAQLQNQDPLDPMDNESFVSQLAQFSSLESMQSVDNSMQTMAEGMKSDRFLLGTNLLGTKINVPGQYSELTEVVTYQAKPMCRRTLSLWTLWFAILTGKSSTSND